MRKMFLFLLTGLSLIFLVACSPLKLKFLEFKKAEELKIVTTTTMMGDLLKELGGNKVVVYTMMAPGVDPHSYSPHKLDIDYLLAADLVVVSGLHLEAKAGQAIEHVENNEIKLIDATQILVDKHNNNHEDGVYLLNWDDDNEASLYDPHFWFNIDYWKIVTTYVSNQLIEIDPDNQQYYQMKHDYYQQELDRLSVYLENRINELEQHQKVLFTAHDAFGYFGQKYSFEVEAVKGISTEHEPSTKDIETLVNIAIAKDIHAVFIENSVPKTVIESLIESARAKNHRLVIGGELLSDSLSSFDKSGSTYIKMLMHNVDTIVDAILNN